MLQTTDKSGFGGVPDSHLRVYFDAFRLCPFGGSNGWNRTPFKLKSRTFGRRTMCIVFRVLRLAIEPAKVPSRRWTRTIRIVLALALVYAVVTYLVVPFGWKRYTVRHPELESIPRVAYTGAGI